MSLYSCLFGRGVFTLNSGLKSDWKIDCDVFTEEDWSTLAWMVVEKGFTFCGVIPVPKGKSISGVDNALRFAHALSGYCNKGSKHELIVDDVYTTGNSIRSCRGIYYSPDKYIGIVAFARSPILPVDQNWVHPIFQYW